MKKLFNKCIMINKWYYKTVVLNYGPRMRPLRPQPTRAIHPQPPARDCSVGPRT